MAGTLDGSAAIGGGEGVAVIVGGGVQLGELVGTAVAVAVAVGNMRLGTSTTTGVGVVAVATAVGAGMLER
jgi:hypothetical protein